MLKTVRTTSRTPPCGSLIKKEEEKEKRRSRRRRRAPIVSCKTLMFDLKNQSSMTRKTFKTPDNPDRYALKTKDLNELPDQGPERA